MVLLFHKRHWLTIVASVELNVLYVMNERKEANKHTVILYMQCVLGLQEQSKLAAQQHSRLHCSYYFDPDVQFLSMGFLQAPQLPGNKYIDGFHTPHCPQHVCKFLCSRLPAIDWYCHVIPSVSRIISGSTLTKIKCLINETDVHLSYSECKA